MLYRLILMAFAAAISGAAAPRIPADSWIPIRWWDRSPGSLDLVTGTTINCLLLPAKVRNPALIKEARRRGLVVLALAGSPDEARDATAYATDGMVLEGAFAAAFRPSDATLIRLPLREAIRFDGHEPVVGTSQGLWPGLQIEHNGKVLAGPSSQPWVFTNAGFLQFARASTSRPLWISVRPAPGAAFPAGRYVEAIADAEISGAHWVITLDDDLAGRLSRRDSLALRDWMTIVEAARYFESPAWRAYHPYATLALVQDRDSGGLLSGGLLDMMSSQHTAVRSIAAGQVDAQALQGVKIVIAVDGAAALTEFRRNGGVVVEPPPDGRFPVLAPGQITLTPQQVNHLESLWELIYKTTVRKNFGSRVFNVNGTLTRVLATPDVSSMLVHLVNYTEYEKTDPVTVHVLGNWKRARLYAPGETVQELQLYPVEGGMGVDIERMKVIATVRVDR